MSEAARGASDEIEALFVDPWSHKANHQSGVPDEARFVGAWERYVGIDSLGRQIMLRCVTQPKAKQRLHCRVAQTQPAQKISP